MSGRFTKTFLAITVLAFGLCAQGITFKEALKKCQGQSTPQCQKVRAMYLKLKRANTQKKPVPVMIKPIATTEEVQSSPEPVKLPEPRWDERGEIKSPFGLRYFSEISGIGENNEDGSSKLGAYAHLDGGYTTRWGATFYARLPFLVDFSTAEGEETITSLDPFFGIKGTLWSSGKWGFWSRLRLILPLSQGSVDNGVTFSWGIDTSLSYDAGIFSAYLAVNPRGQFFGFGTEGDRNNGSVNLELGIEGIKITENSSLNMYFSSGFSRKIGRDLGFLVFNDDSSTGTFLWSFKINKHLSIAPGPRFNFETKDTGFVMWLSGAIF